MDSGSFDGRDPDILDLLEILLIKSKMPQGVKKSPNV